MKRNQQKYQSINNDIDEDESFLNNNNNNNNEQDRYSINSKLSNSSSSDSFDEYRDDKQLLKKNKSYWDSVYDKHHPGIGKTKKERIILWFRTLFYNWKHFFRHTLRVNLRNKLSYSLGFSACFLVVFIVSLCVSIITNTPVVFLSLSEASVGEMDLVLTSNSFTLSNQFNYTMISELLAGTYLSPNGQNYTDYSESSSDFQDDSYHTPRIVYEINAVSASSCPNGDINSNLWKYHNATNANQDCEPHCFDNVCSLSVPSKADLYVIDSQKEKRMGLGRDWSLPSPDQGKVFIQSKVASKLSVSKGDYLYLRISATDFLSSIWVNADPTNSTLPIIYLTVQIQDVFDKRKGKFDNSEDTAIVIDYATFIPFLYTQLDPEMKESSKEFIKDINLYEYTQIMIVNLPPSRLEPYINSNQDTILQHIVDFSNKILYKIGFNEFSSSLPVMGQLSKNRYVALFLGLILNVIIFILLFLSILLIYSLLMIDVETRTFEMGVMRMIGTTRNGIIQLMLFKAFSYSVPSWALGLLVAQIFGFVVSAIFKSITGVPIPTRLTGESILLATALGIIIPIASAIFPIRSALGKNLHDSLDVKHSKTMAVQISIERSEDNNFSSGVALIGLILSVFGFGIYYVFPLSLLSFNLTLLLNMFFMLLIAMLLGLVSLALNVEQIIERLVVYLFLFWEKQAIKSIIVKNLVAHKLRNRKTAIMYAVSLSFIIFVNVSYSMQQSSMNYEVQQSYGSYLTIKSKESFFTQEDTYLIDSFLNQMNPEIADYAWVTSSYSIITQTYQSSQITNLGHIYSDNTNLYAVSPNFFTTTLPGFLKANSIATDPDYPLGDINYLSEQIYSISSGNKLLIGSLYESNIGASLQQPFLLQLNLKKSSTSENNQTRYLVEPVAMLDSAPIFKFSKFPSVLSQDSIVSLPSFLSYSSSVFSSVRELPMKSVVLKLNTSNKNSVEAIKTRIFNYLNTNLNEDFTILDYYDKIAPNATASKIIQYFFSFTTILAMLISFFSLMSSVYSNILEQTKEIGVLRAVGIPKRWMIRIYVYESFVLVLSSSFLGVFIGTIVGWTMILQRVLFTQLPIPFEFPWQLLIVIFLCSMVFSFFSAFGPIRKVLNQPIVNIMRVVT
ncbi:hypothetical protein DICPUDRAFT_56279 [Dictyostelium purpureum]|uniref:ABC3 transporter permease C-terminal domain-containing protein n=1 Tax=Dictyostelium purpureum TaxID=5786 RepID=F0ZQK2_DICPU|nr:uncharacterized protein DICPUDRAFT_56279 [Dictyostelium purpureum]EGC33767.1 hypothetical protein DICPUDRAFT_56279 [Dictyostelium purpureum]|eukprot:XP_003289692.1 hypothetical protein DICPUDRAFT_56279 [Dictyostelium purpureum]